MIPRVFLYGQDIGAFGGAFKATKNLAKEFPGRVLDRRSARTPLSALPLARPSKECVQLWKCNSRIFPYCGFNQIVNHAATLFYRTEVPCPIVVRLPSGGTPGSGPFHSQSMEAIYAHYPGVVVMTPGTVEDVYSMLIEAVAIDDPVLFCEHKFLYNHLKAERLARSCHARVQGAARETGTRRYHRHVWRDAPRVSCSGRGTCRGWL